MLCTKSRHVLNIQNFFHGQRGFAVGELQIYCNVISAPGILAWFCLTANDNRTHHILNPTVISHFSSCLLVFLWYDSCCSVPSHCNYANYVIHNGCTTCPYFGARYQGLNQGFMTLAYKTC